MHELGGLFCKIGNPWINGQNRSAEKKHESGRIWASPTTEGKKMGRWVLSHHGLRPGWRGSRPRRGRRAGPDGAGLGGQGGAGPWRLRLERRPGAGCGKLGRRCWALELRPMRGGGGGARLPRSRWDPRRQGRRRPRSTARRQRRLAVGEEQRRPLRCGSGRDPSVSGRGGEDPATEAARRRESAPATRLGGGGGGRLGRRRI